MKDLRSYINLLFKYRLRTKEELIKRLKKKGFSDEEIEMEIEKLQSEGIIDDERFARIFVREELEKKPVSKTILIKKLVEKGVDFETAKRVVSQEYDEEKLFETVNRIIDKLKKRGKNENKIYEYFMRRGLSSALIKKILSKGLNSPEN